METRHTIDSAKALARRLRRKLFVVRDSTNPADVLRLPAKEVHRLKTLPRRAQTVTYLAGRELAITDPFWFLHSYDEICLKEIYRFQAKTTAPFILDCGANVGLSVIYFKHLYPNAQVIAFEPDPGAFHALSTNMRSFQLADVSVHQKAVWINEMMVTFEPDGSVGGKIVDTSSEKPHIQVDTVRLRNWLDVPIDLLKLDIEGAEYGVLLDCRDHLHQIDHLFVEYHSKPTLSQTLDEILAILKRAGFRYHIQDAYPMAHPFMKAERRSVYDLQLNIFAYRD